MRKGSTIAAIVSSIFPTVLFILLGLKADCIAVYFIGCIAFSIIDFINYVSGVCIQRTTVRNTKNQVRCGRNAKKVINRLKKTGVIGYTDNI